MTFWDVTLFVLSLFISPLAVMFVAVVLGIFAFFVMLPNEFRKYQGRAARWIRNAVCLLVIFFALVVMVWVTDQPYFLRWGA